MHIQLGYDKHRGKWPTKRVDLPRQTYSIENEWFGGEKKSKAELILSGGDISNFSKVIQLLAVKKA